MANEIVNYNNDMNTVALRKFNSVEMDIFIAICTKMKDKDLNIIEFDFDYLKKLIKWTDTNSNSFVEMLDSTYNKLIKCDIKIGNSMEWTRFVLFTKYTISKIKQTVKIGVNTEFRYILNELTSNFTKFELEEFISFKSSYTKEFFRRMKQFRSTGVYKVNIEEFKRMLDIPKSYNMSDIDKRVLNPILEELKPNYGLKMKKIYKAKGVGRPTVIGFEFIFNNNSVVTYLKTENKKLEKQSIIQDKMKKVENENQNRIKFVENCKDYKDFVGKTFSIFDGSKGKFDLYEIIKIEKLDDEKIKIHLKNLANNEIRTKTYQNENEMISSFKNRLVK